jgi:dihydrolipoamide dehydrogenase
MYDLAIIGGGPGGYVAAIRGAQQGLNVLLIEKDTVGGTCLNKGCVPTKSFFYDSKLFNSARTSPVLRGAENLSFDAVKMVQRKQRLVARLGTGLEKAIKSNGIEIVQGIGELVSAGHVRIAQADGSTRTCRAGHIILATGSGPFIPPFIEVDGHHVQTTDEALDTEDIPNRLIIIGGGVVGLEMAAIYLNLGSQVTILELLSDIIITEDQEIRQVMRRLLDQRGAFLHLNTSVQKIEPHSQGVRVSFQKESEVMQALTADRVLVATGRRPVLEGIDPQRLGLEMNGAFIKVNSHLKTSLDGVYAIGDLIGGMMLAHKASAEAETAIANIMGTHKAVDPKRIPRCIWGPAEVGAIGLTEKEARNTGQKIKIGKFPFNASGAAMALGNTDGFVKIIGDEATGEIIGVHILGDHATDLIGEAATLMEMEAAVEDLSEAIKPHPTLSETVSEAALNWRNLAIHIPAFPQS